MNIFKKNQFPIDAFPSFVHSTALELHYNTKAPMPIVAASLLGAMSLACQPLIKVSRGCGLESPVSLFILTVAESGERKSTVDNLVLKAFHQYELEHEESYALAFKEYEMDMVIWDAGQKQLLSDLRKCVKKGEPTDGVKSRLHRYENDKPLKPKRTKLIYSNSTPEALQYGLYTDGKSAGLISDEASIIFEGRAINDLGFINKLWDGSPFSIDRRTSDSFVVHDGRLTLSFMVQDSILRSYFERNGDIPRSSGFIARFMVSCPDSTQGTRFIDGHEMSWDYLNIFHQRMRELLEEYKNADCKEVILRFSPQAQNYWEQVYNDIERRSSVCGDFYPIKDFSAKFADNIARIAAIFHMVSGYSGDISYNTLYDAVDVHHWYSQEILRLFTPKVDVPQYVTDAEQLAPFIQRSLAENNHVPVPKNELRKNCPNKLRKDSRFYTALDFLVQQNHFWCWKGTDNITYVSYPQS